MLVGLQGRRTAPDHLSMTIIPKVLGRTIHWMRGLFTAMIISRLRRDPPLRGIVAGEVRRVSVALITRTSLVATRAMQLRGGMAMRIRLSMHMRTPALLGSPATLGSQRLQRRGLIGHLFPSARCRVMRRHRMGRGLPSRGAFRWKDPPRRAMHLQRHSIGTGLSIRRNPVVRFRYLPAMDMRRPRALLRTSVHRPVMLALGKCMRIWRRSSTRRLNLMLSTDPRPRLFRMRTLRLLSSASRRPANSSMLKSLRGSGLANILVNLLPRPPILCRSVVPN